MNSRSGDCVVSNLKMCGNLYENISSKLYSIDECVVEIAFSIFVNNSCCFGRMIVKTPNILEIVSLSNCFV